MRQIILDTETTGLDPNQGHRIIEIAAVEMVNRRLTGVNLHRYVQPDREIDSGAMQVHGISNEFLLDKPRFGDIAGEFMEFVQGAELIIHNAPFDVGFLNMELKLAGQPLLASLVAGVTDTLAMAKALHPGQRNNLDALCKRYGVDNSARTLHGALVDCELLAAVYLALTRGQESLSIGLDDHVRDELDSVRRERPRPVKVVASGAECEAHAATLAAIAKESKGACLWLTRVAGDTGGGPV
ncbi:MAG: DNA polymerase III subunit epsilon [Hydrogenophilales bacterium 16-64-46]|nr:MAG: DNA polymerase III subunit epsilon [Hydrogenophilales bacterium 12-64-13]OYZ05618.1 MAG: DNA polymerase III subunit epsilon [Hydrogenophilales bacterium 16-64-46]OZA40197.1 MAG: DNA polymerase III subunit epsilon [Hydrogenophilales bacterium 17-64-34]HQT00745.1 DNA polymerase III subunit epsilon [Thiobacillus sp.]